MSIKHIGINAHRIPREESERQFAYAWQKRAPNTLGYLLCGQDRHDHDYSERDAQVAATIIQWLGSAVGSGFIDEVRELIAKETA